MAVRTLQNLLDDSANRAQMSGAIANLGTTITVAEQTQMVNNSLGMLYGMLSSKAPDYYLATHTGLTSSAGVATVPLPPNVLKVVDVDYCRTSGSFDDIISLERGSMRTRDRNRGRLAVASTYFCQSPYSFTVYGDSLLFSPTPQTNDNLRLWYVPVPTPLSASTDSFDFRNGWDEYIINDVASKMLMKLEDPQWLDFQQLAERQLNVIESQATERTPNKVVQTMIDTSCNPWWQGYGWRRGF